MEIREPKYIDQIFIPMLFYKRRASLLIGKGILSFTTDRFVLMLERFVCSSNRKVALISPFSIFRLLPSITWPPRSLTKLLWHNFNSIDDSQECCLLRLSPLSLQTYAMNKGAAIMLSKLRLVYYDGYPQIRYERELQIRNSVIN